MVLQLKIVPSPFPTICVCMNSLSFLLLLPLEHAQGTSRRMEGGVGLASGALEVPACQLWGLSGEVLPEDHRWACHSRIYVPLML